MCDVCRCALMLKVKINKIHSANAIERVNFRRKAPLHTHMLFTESETGSNDTNIYVSKMSAVNNLSFHFASQFLKLQLYFELEYLPMKCLLWAQYDNSCCKVLIAVLKERIRLGSLKDHRLRYSSLSKPSCLLPSLPFCQITVQCMPTKSIFTGGPGGQFTVQVPQSATCVLCDSNQVTLRFFNTRRNLCHVGVRHLTGLENLSCRISVFLVSPCATRIWRQKTPSRILCFVWNLNEKTSIRVRYSNIVVMEIWSSVKNKYLSKNCLCGKKSVSIKALSI